MSDPKTSHSKNELATPRRRLEWFDIRRYTPPAEITPLGLYGLVAARFAVALALAPILFEGGGRNAEALSQDDPVPQLGEVETISRAKAIEQLARIRENPFKIRYDIIRWSGCPIRKARKGSSQSSQSVGSMTFQDLAGLIRSLELTVRGEKRVDWNRFNAAPIKENLRAWMLQSTHEGQVSLFGAAFGFLRIDLNKTDRLIKTQFEDWLHLARQNWTSSLVGQGSDQGCALGKTEWFQDLAGNSKHSLDMKYMAKTVLPCMDLLIVAADRRQVLSPHEIATELGHSGEENIRSRVIPLVRRILADYARRGRIYQSLVADAQADLNSTFD